MNDFAEAFIAMIFIVAFVLLGTMLIAWGNSW